MINVLALNALSFLLWFVDLFFTGGACVAGQRPRGAKPRGGTQVGRRGKLWAVSGFSAAFSFSPSPFLGFLPPVLVCFFTGLFALLCFAQP